MPMFKTGRLFEMAASMETWGPKQQGQVWEEESSEPVLGLECSVGRRSKVSSLPEEALGIRKKWFSCSPTLTGI